MPLRGRAASARGATRQGAAPAAPAAGRKAIERIVFSGDFLRPVDDGTGRNPNDLRNFRSSQTDNIFWFFHLFKRKLAEATGLPATIRTWGHGIDTPLVYDLLGAERSALGWAQAFATHEVPRDFLGLVEQVFGGSLVVSFELTESVKLALSHLGIPYVDFSMHPIRFMPDVFFAVQTNHAKVFEALKPHHTASADYYDWADILLANAVKMKKPKVPEGATLLIGQTNVDRSLIFDGKLRNLSDFREQLAGILDPEKPVLYKPHPYNPHGFGLYESGIPFERVHWTSDNIYTLLASENVEQVLGVSSSVMIEAPYFDKASKFLARSPFSIPEKAEDAKPGEFFSIYDGCFNADFWRDILAGVMPVTAPDGRRFQRPAHMLRTSLRNFWGFNEMSTDFMVSLYQR